MGVRSLSPHFQWCSTKYVMFGCGIEPRTLRMTSRQMNLSLSFAVFPTLTRRRLIRRVRAIPATGKRPPPPHNMAGAPLAWVEFWIYWRHWWCCFCRHRPIITTHTTTSIVLTNCVFGDLTERMARGVVITIKIKVQLQ